MEYNNNNPEIGHGSDKEQEIDLMELACKLWDNRRTIIKWCIGGLVVGLVVAFSIPREYSTTVKLTPELRGKSAGGGMSALASLAGVNLGSDASVDAVYPELYPDVLNSTPFMVELLSARKRYDGAGDNHQTYVVAVVEFGYKRRAGLAFFVQEPACGVRYYRPLSSDNQAGGNCFKVVESHLG